MVTMVDRKTRILFSKRAESKKTADVMRTIGSILNSLPTSQIQTLTPDRGNEFSAQDEITNKFNVQFYFPDPHGAIRQSGMKHMGSLGLTQPAFVNRQLR